MCTIIIVKCSWDGLPEGRNCSCVWSFWCSELCSGNSSKRECTGCEGSRVILPALFLTLDKYSSWRVGRVVPMNRSAVRTTLRSLLRSDLVAELNQTVIDVYTHTHILYMYYIYICILMIIGIIMNYYNNFLSLIHKNIKQFHDAGLANFLTLTPLSNF